MENRIVKFKSKESAGLNLHAIPGHFATSHSHINYYVDVTRQRKLQRLFTPRYRIIHI